MTSPIEEPHETLSEDEQEMKKLLSTGMSYGDFDDQMQGISLSISGDMMLFGIGKTARDFFAATIQSMRENEARVREISVDQVLQLPPETMLDESTLRIWITAGQTFDKERRE